MPSPRSAEDNTYTFVNVEDAVNKNSSSPIRDGNKEPLIMADYREKDPDKSPARKTRSRLQRDRKGNRTMIRLEKKLRAPISNDANTTKTQPPKFIFDDGAISIAGCSSVGNESSHQNASNAASTIRVPEFQNLIHFGGGGGGGGGSVRSNTGTISVGSNKKKKTYFGLSNDLQEAAGGATASVTFKGSKQSHSSSHYQRNYQDPPSAIFPSGFQFTTPRLLNQSSAANRGSHLPPVGEEERKMMKKERNLDHYIASRIGDTRFIPDEENPEGGALLFRKQDEGDDPSLQDHSDNTFMEFWRFKTRVMREIKHERRFQAGLCTIILVVCITVVAVFTGGSSTSSGSNNQTVSGSGDARVIPTRPLPSSPPDFNPDNVSRDLDAQVWNADTLRAMFEAFSHSEALEDATTPQGKAYQWLQNDTLDRTISASRLQQRYSLVVLYHALSSSAKPWTHDDGWLTTKHECTWFGVKCGRDGSNSFPMMDDSGRRRRTVDDTMGFSAMVTVVDLAENNLIGTVPQELEALSDLAQLRLSKNFLEGSLPSAFSNMPFLHTLFLDNNFLSGEIPNVFEQIDLLENLDLSNNSFDGTFPSSIRSATKLRDVRLSSNNLHGSLPDAFADATDLKVMLVGNNGLSGSLPESLAQLTGLEALELYENELTGAIPSFHSTTSMQHLYLDMNGLTGSVPVELGELTALKQMWLNSNYLTGTLPHELGRLERTTVLKVDGNNLAGSVPGSLCRLKSDHELVSFRATCRGNSELLCDCCDSC